ncbi:MAG: arginine repressor, partial [Parasporobacterium sp.]|nr:arginine repressor [Parasporobacterium sp.]
LERDKYLRICSNGLIKMDQAMNLVVIKTFSGMAMAVAAALDELKMPEIVGSIAGDDTIMCACRSIEDAAQLMHDIDALLKVTR